MMTKTEALSVLADVDHRRTMAFREASGQCISSRELLQRVEDATTQRDIDSLGEIRKMLDPFAMYVLDIYTQVWQSFGKYRCSVCGMTPQQAADANYDCINEC